MKILFAATRAWHGDDKVATVLDSIAGDEPVHLVVGSGQPGPEAFVVAWAKQRAKLRRTFVDVVKAGAEFGPDRSQWKARRDAHMVQLGGYDVAVVLTRRMPQRSKSTRLDDLVRMAEAAGIAVKKFDYDEGATP